MRSFDVPAFEVDGEAHGVADAGAVVYPAMRRRQGGDEPVVDDFERAQYAVLQQGSDGARRRGDVPGWEVGDVGDEQHAAGVAVDGLGCHFTPRHR